MEIKVANVLLGLILIGVSGFTIIPESIGIINSGGGPHGYGYMLMPIYLVLFLCSLSGFFGFINYEKYPVLVGKAMVFFFAIVFFIGLFSLFFFPYVFLFMLVPLSITFTFIIDWKFPLKYRILLANSLILTELLIWKFLF